MFLPAAFPHAFSVLVTLLRELFVVRLESGVDGRGLLAAVTELGFLFGFGRWWRLWVEEEPGEYWEVMCRAVVVGDHVEG